MDNEDNIKKPSIKTTLILGNGLIGIIGARAAYRNTPGSKLRKLTKSLCAFAEGYSTETIDTLVDYTLTADYEYMQQDKQATLTILSKTYTTESITTQITDNTYFAASLKQPGEKTLEAMVQFTRNTKPLRITLEKIENRYTPTIVKYGKKTIYTKKTT